MELDDPGFKPVDLSPDYREEDRPGLAMPGQQAETEIPASQPRRRRGKLQQSALTGRDGGTLYGRSPASCDRHLRRSRARASTNNKKPQALVDAEMEMGLAHGSRVAEKAMRAVRQANAQVCFANLETARKEISLGVARKKYKRLEADMFRSRIELADTLSEVERDHQKHEIAMKHAEERTQELEVALRAADEVLRQLTAEAKRKRFDAEDREASLRANLAALERRVEASERECRNQKISTWGTVARETERAAGRERYRMAAFLQRYVLENEFLRLSKTKAEESASDLLERLRRTEGKLVKALTAPPVPLGGAEPTAQNLHESPWTVGLQGGATGTGMGGGLQWQRNRESLVAGPSPPNDLQGRFTVRVGATAIMAARHLKGRAGGGGSGEDSSGRSSGSGSSDDDGSRRGSSRGRRGGECRSQQAATASAQGELRYTRGLVAELSFLLSATEGERDSLASLLVLAERRMDQLVVAQEELALNLAWRNISVMEERQVRLKQGQQDQQQHEQRRRECGAEYDGDGDAVTYCTHSTVAARLDGGSTAIEQKRQQLKVRSIVLESEKSVGSDVYSPVNGTVSGGGGVPAASTSTTAIKLEQSRASLETLELRRRVRELEVLQKATEAGLRETKAENRRLKSCRRGPPPPWMTWGDGGGVVGSTASGEQRQPPSQGDGIETTTGTVDVRPTGRNSSETAGAWPGVRRGRRVNSREDDRSNNNGTSGLKGRDPSQESGVRRAEDMPPTASVDRSPPLPMLSAAEIGSSSCSRSSSRGNSGGSGDFTSERTGIAGASKGSFSGVGQPQDWGWGGSAGASPRPEERCRPRSSPLFQHTHGQQDCTDGNRQQQQGRHRRHRVSSRGERGGFGTDSCSNVDIGAHDDDDGSLLVKGKLAWVLGLPAETTTENELLAEVMHLVVERGTARTDANALKVQLNKMDDQELSISRLLASTTDTSQESNNPSAPLADDGRAGSRRGDGRSGNGFSFADIDVGYSTDATFLSSLTHRGTGGGAAGAMVEDSRVSTAGKARRRKHAQRAPAGSERDERTNSTQERTAGAAKGAATGTATTPPQKSNPSRGGRTDAMQVSGGQRGATLAAVDLRSNEPGGNVITAQGGRAAAGKAALPKPGGGLNVSLDDGTIRRSFSKTLQGRVISIDVFCTKVLPELEQKQQQQGGGHRESGAKMDDADYEIRVEAYDPAMLKHHVLHILDKHIKLCLSDHPHLYTLGSHRTRVHQSLVDRLVFMSEDVARVERTQQGRGGTRGRDGGSDNDSADSRARKDRPSAVVTTPAPGGGAAASAVGPRSDPRQLLVLIGDAGEIVTAENPRGEDNADSDGGGAAVTSRQTVQRQTKSSIMEIEKDEEVVEGVVYQHHPPMQDDVNPEQAKIARNLLMVDSESSQEEDSDEEDEASSSEYEESDDDEDSEVEDDED